MPRKKPLPFGGVAPDEFPEAGRVKPRKMPRLPRPAVSTAPKWRAPAQVCRWLMTDTGARILEFLTTHPRAPQSAVEVALIGARPPRVSGVTNAASFARREAEKVVNTTLTNLVRLKYLHVFAYDGVKSDSWTMSNCVRAKSWTFAVTDGGAVALADWKFLPRKAETS